jgi:hypothetical protein
MSSKKERKKQNLSLFSQHGNTNKSEVTNPVTELEETSRKVHLLGSIAFLQQQKFFLTKFTKI